MTGKLEPWAVIERLELATAALAGGVVSVDDIWMPTAEARTALLLATDLHALEDPLLAFLTLDANLQAWVLRHRRCTGLIGTFVGLAPDYLVEVLQVVNERLKATRQRVGALLGG